MSTDGLRNLADLQSFADQIVEADRIPAVSIAILRDGELHKAAAGILNMNTGVTATTDSIFQIGSITKVMTTCLVMQLVDEGRVELDAPVRDYVRDFQLADSMATETITVRQLLNHTSGMAGDYFPDDRGQSGNLIARYVDRCNLLPLVHRVGAYYSYSNSAFVLAGRLVELVRGISWYQAMQDYIFTPLSMKHALADPQDVIRYRAAMGHLRCAGGAQANKSHWAVSPKAWLSLGMAPCGSTPMMSAEDLLIFSQAHLQGGRTKAGDCWLSEKSVADMQYPEIDLPVLSQCFTRQMGLGWAKYSYNKSDVASIGHDGATRGFYATIRLFPEHNTAFAVLLNGVCPTTLKSITDALLEHLVGVKTAEPPIDKNASLAERDTAIIGHYESFDKSIDIYQENGQLKAQLMYKIDPLPNQLLDLYPIANQYYGAENQQGVRQPNWTFVGEGAVPEYLFDGSRLNPRLK